MTAEAGAPEASRLVVGVQPVREAIARHGSALGAVLAEQRPSVRLRKLARFAEDHGATVR